MSKRDRKAHRMEVRRKLGLRRPRPPLKIASQRWTPRLFAYACFACRLSFKRRLAKEGQTHACPTCGAETSEMGRYFRAPKRTDVKQWRKIQLLWIAGYRFNGRSKGPPFPARVSEVEAFIRDNPRHPNRLRAYWV